MNRKVTALFMMILLCALLTSCVSYAPVQENSSEIWHAEILGESASLTLRADGTCLLDIAVEDYLYDGTWQRGDALLTLTLTAIHRAEGYEIPVGEMSFQLIDDELVWLIDGFEEEVIFRREASSAPTPAPSPAAP